VRSASICVLRDGQMSNTTCAPSLGMNIADVDAVFASARAGAAGFFGVDMPTEQRRKTDFQRSGSEIFGRRNLRTNGLILIRKIRLLPEFGRIVNSG